MTQLTLICVGTVKEPYIQQAIDAYEKRLGAFCRVETIALKEARITREDDPAAVRAALEEEGRQILSRIPAGAYTVALCVEGEMPDSPGLAQMLGRAVDGSGKICFIIGSSHGLSPAVKAAAQQRLSVSRLTFPHQWMRVILWEAVYRSFTILTGRPYHK